MCTPKCLVKGSDGMFWWLTLVLSAIVDSIASIKIQFYVSKTPVKADFTVTTASGFKEHYKHIFATSTETPFFIFLNVDEHVIEKTSHQLRLTFDAIFQTPKPVISEAFQKKDLSALQRMHKNFQDFDAEVLVGLELIKVHQNYLSLISPVFAAMFSKGCKQTPCSTVAVLETASKVVKKVIGYCYGEQLDDMTTNELDQAYKFAKKY